MTRSPLAWYRATLTLFQRDWRDRTTGLADTQFPLRDLPWSVGDAHVENFGTLPSPDGPRVEPNDLDHAARLPYHHDLRRLMVSLSLAVRRSNDDAPAARAAAIAHERAIVRAAALGYLDGLTRDAVYTAPALDALVAQAEASRDEALRTLTRVVDGRRVLVRGVVDAREPERVHDELSADARARLPSLLDAGRTTLGGSFDRSYFQVLDAVRALGRGGMTFTAARALVLLRGPTDAPDDDVLVELKALTQPGSSLERARPATELRDRVLTARTMLWSRPDADPLWGAFVDGACAVQMRSESGAARGIRASKFEGALGTVDALTALARALGAIVGRAHRRSRSHDLSAVNGWAAARESFADEHVAVSMRYADRVLDDQQRARAWATSAHGVRATRPERVCPLFEATVTR